MSIRALESFDFYATTAQMLNRAGFLQWGTKNTGEAGDSFVAGRFDGIGQAYAVNGIGLVGSLAVNMAAGTLGFGVFLTNGTGGFTINGLETNSGATQWSVTFNPDGSITHPFGRTGNNLFPQSSWFFIEIGWTNAKSGGTIVVKINETAFISATGNTSPNTSNAWTNGLSFEGTVYVEMDDLYINDTAVTPGTYPCNSFSGDRRIYLLSPHAIGTATGWTPSNGADQNYQMVQSADGDTTYNQASTASAEDLFYLSALPSSVQNVIGVQITGMYRKTDATNHTLTQRIKSGSVDQAGVGYLAPYTLTTSYVFYSDVFAVDPNTGTTWTLTALASGTIQAGYRLET